MICSHCESEFSKEDLRYHLVRCIYCGETLVNAEAGSDITMESALRLIIENFGKDILMKENKAPAIFADIAPKLTRERIALSEAFKERTVLKLASCGENERATIAVECVKNLEGVLSESAVRAVICSVAYALDIDTSFMKKAFVKSVPKRNASQKEHEQKVSDIQTSPKVSPPRTAPTQPYRQTQNTTRTAINKNAVRYVVKPKKKFTLFHLGLLIVAAVLIGKTYNYIQNKNRSSEAEYESISEVSEISEEISETDAKEEKNTEISVPVIPEDAVVHSGHYYKVYDESMTWSDAEAFCQNLGGHLAAVNSEREQVYLEKLTSECGKNNIWIGGYLEGGEWKWTNGSDFSYSNWDSYIWNDGVEVIKPDNYDGNECYIRYANADMEYENWRAYKGKWDDTSDWADGSEGDAPLSSFGFVCEWLP